MKKTCFLLAFLIAISFLSAQFADPKPDIINMISMVNADTLKAYVQHLQNYQKRYALADNHLEVANWIKGKFESYGFTNTWMQEYPHNNTTQYNVIATIPGYLYPDIYIIVGGHYDSISFNSDFFTFAPGADDNASGTAGVLEIARVMMATGYQPKCSIRFIAFSAEEGSAWGSETYCDYAIAENQNIRVMINLDMVANNLEVSQEFRVMPYLGCEEYSYETMRIAELYSSYQPVLGVTGMGSDSSIFSRNGFNAVFFFERYISSYYHSNEDLIDYLDFQYEAEIVKAATATVAVFANQPILVENLKVYDPGTGNSLLAEWDISSDPEVTKYAVYYGTEIDSLTFWQYVNANQCSISGLEEGLYYNIAVCAVNDSGFVSMRKFASGIPFSVPTTPNLIADFPDTTSITIKWLPNPELDIVSYSIYRSLGLNGTKTLIATVSFSDTAYIDANVESNEEYYYYSITANDLEGNQSQFSAPLASRIISMDRGIYVIDESKNFSGTSPFQPTDEAVDDFYNDLLENFENVSHLDLEEQTSILKMADIGIYSSIL
ncbi:MAG: M20/M25/M40 family metallo-hydrolase [Candidatus Cloacimonas sp.]